MAKKEWNVASQKQLFLDDRLIEKCKGITLTMNPPRKMGPVVLPDKPCESEQMGFCTSVAEADGVFKMWYRCTVQKGPSFVCYAISKDGLRWEKPDLGLIEFNGSKKNNIVMKDVSEVVVFLDPHGTADARYKAVAVKYWPDPKKAGLYVHTSPDGIRWNLSDDRAFPIAPDTANQAMWDTRLKKYVAYIRIWKPMRKVGRVEMDDILKPWPFKKIEDPYYIWGKDKIAVPSKEVETAFEYDDKDPVPSDHYNPAAVEYPWAEDAYFLFPSAYMHFPDPPKGKYGNDGLLDIQLAVSRDGVKYHRIDRRPYICLGPEGEKDSKSLYMAVGMLRKDDQIMQYYAGYEVTHGEPARRNQGSIGSLCCAVQRLDGFVSADAAYEGGELTTPPIRFEGNRLELNVDTSALGLVRVGVLDAKGKALPEYSVEKCDPIQGNYVHRIVTWGGKPDVSSLSGKPIRLRFEMRSAKLYAFQFKTD